MLLLKKLKLGTKLNLILALILVSIVAACGLLLSRVLKHKVEREVADKAFLIIETMNSVRNYTSTQIKPQLASRLATESDFISTTVPAYSAREIFEGLRKQPEYQDFLYKEATLNPTNLRDKADRFETTITNQFRQDKSLKELTGFRSINQENFYYIARPMAIKKASCLECHGTPQDAPPSLLNTYGKQHGFGWKLDEIVASQIVLVPASKIFNAARQLQFSIIGIIGIFFVGAIAALNLFLKNLIINPIQRMARLSTEISTGDFSVEFNHDNQDEIGLLAAALNRMKLSLQMAMNMLNDEPES